MHIDTDQPMVTSSLQLLCSAAQLLWQ